MGGHRLHTLRPMMEDVVASAGLVDVRHLIQRNKFVIQGTQRQPPHVMGLLPVFSLEEYRHVMYTIAPVDHAHGFAFISDPDCIHDLRRTYTEPRHLLRPETDLQ